MERLVHIVTVALSFASMLYRADWAYLMNVYPPLLIVSIVALHRASVTVAARRAARARRRSGTPACSWRR
jgi:hypothetical protein